jgi:glutamine synthetase
MSPARHHGLRKHEVDPIRLRPHPHEFEMYFDI